MVIILLAIIDILLGRIIRFTPPLLNTYLVSVSWSA